ncbi:hypothetical protein C0Q70_10619 [Pomacea canaliculata]|uniref:Uncharacterized protein n=1 Tax=Pomacea canaliculata TaxID=400727 RepID=A0A2T7P3Q6_POMCA|nr:hypothetical protein C0Q70_10619 [Pomacea canaliculata]
MQTCISEVAEQSFLESGTLLPPDSAPGVCAPSVTAKCLRVTWYRRGWQTAIAVQQDDHEYVMNIVSRTCGVSPENGAHASRDELAGWHGSGVEEAMSEKGLDSQVPKSQLITLHVRRVHVHARTSCYSYTSHAACASPRAQKVTPPHLSVTSPLLPHPTPSTPLLASSLTSLTLAIPPSPTCPSTCTPLALPEIASNGNRRASGQEEGALLALSLPRYLVSLLVSFQIFPFLPPHPPQLSLSRRTLSGTSENANAFNVFLKAIFSQCKPPDPPKAPSCEEQVDLNTRGGRTGLGFEK